MEPVIRPLLTKSFVRTDTRNLYVMELQTLFHKELLHKSGQTPGTFM
ncbi:Uncharacterized protein dnm_041850 [Desulfonema magnum]|uniref:Uncharacterized protein n=1 Tax=Desulfonema magnum TaxID=45655 RepID=A0A975BMF9_9BACT|nr:Uncharacterized protein dnm_041850 [Desulfonema magnum]